MTNAINKNHVNFLVDQMGFSYFEQLEDGEKDH